MQGLGWEGYLCAVLANNFIYLQQHILFYFVIVNPINRFGKTVNKKIQRRCIELIEIDDGGLAGVDFIIID